MTIWAAWAIDWLMWVILMSMVVGYLFFVHRLLRRDERNQCKARHPGYHKRCLLRKDHLGLHEHWIGIYRSNRVFW